MRYSDENYEIGELWIEKETGNRFVCIGLELCEDTYYDVVYIISEEEFLKNTNTEIRESDLKSFNAIERYNFSDYDGIRGRKYEIETKTVYNFKKLH